MYPQMFFVLGSSEWLGLDRFFAEKWLWDDTRIKTTKNEKKLNVVCSESSMSADIIPTSILKKPFGSDSREIFKL